MSPHSEVTFGPAGVMIRWDDGAVALIDPLVLAANCRCHECRDSITGQRKNVVPVDSPEFELSHEDPAVLKFRGGSHHGFVAIGDFRPFARPRGSLPNKRFWRGDEDDNLPFYSWSTPFEEWEIDRLCTALVVEGFAVIRHGPAAKGTVESFARLFTRIKENRFGRTFEVKSVARPDNLAFGAGDLPIHTDNPYRDPVPSLQFLHCVTPAASGGGSVIVDGEGVCRDLKDKQPEVFELLTSTPVRFRYETQGVAFEAVSPLIECRTNGELAIRYNDRSMLGPMTADASGFYRAFAALTDALFSTNRRVLFDLAAGDLYVVDNHRMLHGRSGFSTTSPRFLEGCYGERDWAESRARLAFANRRLTGVSDYSRGASKHSLSPHRAS